MQSRYRSILIGIILVIIYIIYLIIVDTYRNFQKDTYIEYLTEKNTTIQDTIDNKRAYNEYIRTRAYKERIAKASQWKQLPWEVIINLVGSEEVESYKTFDVAGEIVRAIQNKPSPTQGMRNTEKWIYYIFRTDIRTTDE